MLPVGLPGLGTGAILDARPVQRHSIRLKMILSATTAPYLERVNLAIDHVVDHLNEPLRLRELSRAARLSPFCRLQSETAQLFEPDGYQLGGCGLICCVKDGGGKVIPS